MYMWFDRILELNFVAFKHCVQIIKSVGKVKKKKLQQTTLISR